MSALVSNNNLDLIADIHRLSKSQDLENGDFATINSRTKNDRYLNSIGDMGNQMSETLGRGEMTTRSSEGQDINLTNQEGRLQKPHLSTTTTTTTTPTPPPPQPRRNCRAPTSRKFAHPCLCSGQTPSSFIYHHTRQPRISSGSTNNNTDLPAIANSNPFYLYESNLKKCFPTSRQRDMLLRECHIAPSLNQAASTLTTVPQVTNSDNVVTSNFNLSTYARSPNGKHQAQPGNCYYSDLSCDSRHHRCVCKPNYLLLFDHSSSSFGCVPIENALTGSPDKTVNCKPGSVYNVISKDCQRLFDVSELPPSHAVGPYVNQFSFLTIVLIWILLLLIILIAKLKRIRAKNLFRATQSSTMSGDRRSDYSHSHGHRHHHHPSSISHHGSRHSHGYVRGGQNQHSIPSSWFHPFIAAVNGHHNLNQHRGILDRNTRRSIDESGNYNDTDFFLANGTRRFGEIMADGNLVGSQMSINNPPPKFEEIYPSCPPDIQVSQHFIDQQHHLQQPQQPEQQQLQHIVPLPSNEDLPTYDEAMKLQNTKPPDLK